MTELIWSCAARRDLMEIADYYGRADPALPYELLVLVDQAPIVLFDFPSIGSPTKKRGVRKWPVKGTPLLLFYAHVGNRIEIRRVRHVRTNWRDT